MIKINLLIAFLIIVGAASYTVLHKNPVASVQNVKSKITKVVKTQSIPAPKLATNYCANGSDQEIIVSISKQHLWACSGTTTQYDSAVITGMQMYPADLTPVGTYKIYGKQI